MRGFLGGRFDGPQAVGCDASEDRHHLQISSGTFFSLRRTLSMVAGRTQSRNGAPLRSAPGLRTRTGT